MASVSLRQLLDHAAEHGHGVPAFNVNNMEQLPGVVAAARRTSSPVCVQASRGARAYAGDAMLRRMVQAITEADPDIPVCLHQAHGNGPATCLSAIPSSTASPA
jgi:fructose-bisphosphate aldolase class II